MKNRLSQAVQLLYVLIIKDLRVRYKSSLLGYLWALLNPLCYTVVYYIAFEIVMKQQVPHYPTYLITGLFPWSWMSLAIVQGAATYRSNETLIRKVKIPIVLLPLSVALQEMVHFLFAMPVLILATAMAIGGFRAEWVVLVPLITLVQLLVIYPSAVILASINVVVRDIEYIVAIVLQMLFFLTPVVYVDTAVPSQYRRIFRLSPFYALLSAWRAALYNGRFDIVDLLYCLAFAASAAGVALLVHRRIGTRVAELL